MNLMPVGERVQITAQARVEAEVTCPRIHQGRSQATCLTSKLHNETEAKDCPVATEPTLLPCFGFFPHQYSLAFVLLGDRGSSSPADSETTS